jgi:hypothetical protein
MSGDLEIRPAEPTEVAALTKLAISSKAVWGYREDEMAVFARERSRKALP